MEQLVNLNEFVSFRQRILSEKKFLNGKITLTVSAGTCGQASGANDVIRIIKKYILKRSLQERIALKITGCQGFCEMEPFVLVEPGLHLYPKIHPDNIPRIVDAELNGHVDEGLLYKDPIALKTYTNQEEIPFFKKQNRLVLKMNQEIDPIRILDYIEVGGYSALEKVLQKSDPDWLISEIKASGLRGRGGAGFPTGRKWELARKFSLKARQSYIVCNADEGDPGAYMDRSLLEGNPHRIIEGMLIAGIAIGAKNGIIYVRSEYPLAIKHTMIALHQAEDSGLLGKNILNTGYDFEIQIVRGAGAFVCGEETALIRSIEGYRGEPRQRPPYPIEKGIDGFPTCINNVETLANVSIIINMGAEKYAQIGIPGNTGTKIFSLVGKIKNTGLVEVPLGTKINEVVYNIGGGAPGNSKVKAVQTGGPSGGCIPVSMFELPIDYESLNKVGSIMGSGGMIVMDENTCMVDVAKYFMKFLKEESCGKCFTCRKGTQRLYELLDDITRGTATMGHLDLLEELAIVVRDTSMCGLGQSAANPILSTMKYFRNEYEQHILNKKCDAFVCSNLVGAPCQSACPLGTEAWKYIAHIARGEYEEAYITIREANPFPSVCARVCDHPCEVKCKSGTSGGEAIAVRALKRFITDRTDPSIYKPKREYSKYKKDKVAVIGSGPAGLTAAHYLSLKGYKVSIFEAENNYGGMLTCAIPTYRLPKEVILAEISSILDDNISITCNTALGRDISVDGLLADGYSAVLLALGAHKSRPLEIENENVPGVLPSIEFLKSFNMKGQSQAKGRVGVIGGGNSAIDAARVALRQRDVQNVTILYRRTKEEMPAFAEEIEAAEQEGIEIKTLVTPLKISTSNGKLSGICCIKNELGDVDSSGRRKPVAIPGTEFALEFDTLIVAISEDSGKEVISAIHQSGIETKDNNTIKADPRTLQTSMKGVFAAGDVITGPNTVIQAIATGKRAALMIDRYLSGVPLEQPIEAKLPKDYIEPLEKTPEEDETSKRIETMRAAAEWRIRNFSEVEVSLSAEEAFREASRCLRCDLEFTTPKVCTKSEVREVMVNA
ncbi:MAG: hydrogenase [Ignavibacteria bacterium]|nr:hydrogenase [Ignavibacteria bacterium]